MFRGPDHFHSDERETYNRRVAAGAKRPMVKASKPVPPKPTVPDIDDPFFMSKLLPLVAYHGGITPEDLKSPCRRGHIMTVRTAFYRMARDRGASLQQIGRICGGRDHSTVISGLRKHDAEPGRYAVIIGKVCTDLGWTNRDGGQEI